MTAFGIDLGTTNSAIAHLVDGKPSLLSVDGDVLVPSVVAYEKEGVIVGRRARNLELHQPLSTIRSVKRKMGTDHVYAVHGRQVTPAQVSAEVLSALVTAAAESTGETLREAVITVPAYFNDAQRKATLAAGELAGLHVLRLLNEPTSASLVYERVGQGRVSSSETELVLVYDLGGGTFDVSVLEVADEIREVRATAGNTHLGGDDFDELLVAMFLESLGGAGSENLKEDPCVMARLRRAAEKAKIQLSTDTEVDVQEEFLAQGATGKPMHLNLTVGRRRFESLIAKSLESTIDLAHKALDEAGIKAKDLSRVVLVGGSTRIPLCQQLLSEAFDTEIHQEVHPDQAVALGAAIQAGMLTGANVDRILIDVAARSLGVRVVGEYRDGDGFSVLIPRNTALPAERAEEYYTVVEDQKAVSVDVYQGESSRASENTEVGSFEFKLKPSPLSSPVRMAIAYDLNGMIKVSASQPGKTGEKIVSMPISEASTQPSIQTQPKTKPSIVERKAATVLEQISGATKEELDSLLGAYRRAPPEQRAEVEEALLDFLHVHSDESVKPSKDAEC